MSSAMYLRMIYDLWIQAGRLASMRNRENEETAGVNRIRSQELAEKAVKALRALVDVCVDGDTVEHACLKAAGVVAYAAARLPRDSRHFMCCIMIQSPSVEQLEEVVDAVTK